MLRLRVLVVDDEVELGHLLAAFLERVGHDVATALSGEQAWLAVRSAPEPFEAFVIDLALTGMGGDELAARILQFRPESRIILTSAYPYDPSAISADGSRVSYLQKPFSPWEIEEKLLEMAAQDAPCEFLARAG